MKITYDSNNSGGGWWLEDKDWLALEKAGWTVLWGGVYFCHPTYDPCPKGKPEPCESRDTCPGHRKYNSAPEAINDRWLGALATAAFKNFPTPAAAMREFEKITGAKVSDEGYNCCGAPHRFSWEGGYASGEDCLKYLYNNPPKPLREAVELLKGKGK